MPRELPQRATIRWQGYDYANVGAYYLTIVTDDRRPLFDRIVDGALQPSPIGELAQRCWDAIPEHMPHVGIGQFVVMPNHVHGIVVIRDRLVVPVGADHDRPGIATDHDRPGTIPDPDTMQRPDTMPEPNATPNTGSPNAMADAPDERTANAPTAPTAQMRADHDRPQRPPTPDAPPKRTPMPIVPVGSLGRIVRAYKSAVTRLAYRAGLLHHGTPVWQRNYWDRVIRDDGEYDRIAKYIRDNPMNWKGDRFNER